jgi:hypothetical protein
MMTPTTITAREGGVADATSAVHRAAEEAIELVQSLSESKELVGTDPQAAWQQLDAARQKLIDAWDALDVALKSREKSSSGEGSESSSDVPAEGIDEDRIRVEYMDMITDAFQDVLEDLRQKQGDQLDVEVLIDCLSSGLELLTQQDKEWLLDEQEPEMSELTPHERRRRDLGLLSSTDE